MPTCVGVDPSLSFKFFITDCSNDADGDGVSDEQDVCPYNKLISTTSFIDYFVVKLDPEGTAQIDPEWKFSDKVRIMHSSQ